MILYLLHSWKIFPVSLGIIWTAALTVIAETSVFTPWILGALVPISLGILAMLWKMQGRLSVLETQVTPLWSVLQKEVAEALHHPHPEAQEMDRLLEKLEHLTITDSERACLVELLHERSMNPKQSENEQKRAELLLFIMPRVIREQAGEKIEAV